MQFILRFPKDIFPMTSTQVSKIFLLLPRFHDPFMDKPHPCLLTLFLS